MNQETKIFFIINPVAGSAKGVDKNLIESFFSAGEYHVKTEYTTAKGHGAELTRKAISSGYKIIVAAGGDGTVNEIGTALIHSDCALGIIPLGSGNGLARHHKIPVNLTGALQIIKQNKQTPHDAVRVNEYTSFNVSGIGFDAHVAHLFGKDGKRGFKSYAKLVIKEYKNYHNFHFTIDSGSGPTSYQAMMVTIANSSQFGNNAFIAPAASTSDGKVDITIVKKMSFLNLPMFAMRIFNKTVSRSPFATLFQGENFIIHCKEKLPLHIDGDAAGFNDTFSIHTLKNAIKIIVP